MIIQVKAFAVVITEKKGCAWGAYAPTHTLYPAFFKPRLVVINHAVKNG